MLNHQLIFTHVLTALRTQAKPALSDMGGCVYIAENGSRCAVGHLIDQSLYTDDMEGAPIGNRPNVVAAIKPEFGVSDSVTDPDFLRELQRYMHDSLSDFVDDEEGFLLALEKHAKEFALRWLLEYSPC